MEDSSGSSPAPRLLRRTLALAGVLAVYHFVLAWLMRSTGLVLGVVRPGTKVYRPVPLYCYFRPHFKFGLILAVVVLVGFWRWLSRVAWDTGRLRRSFVPAAMGWYVVLACTVAMIDGGPERLWRPYEAMRGTNYLTAIDRVESVRGFLGDYTEIQTTLPMHCRTHPPGGILFLWMIHRYIRPGAAAAALATILAASLAIPAVHGLAREVAGRRTARLATTLFIIAPNVLLFTATSMEAVFMVPMIWTFYLLFRTRRGRPVLFGSLGGLTAGVAAMMTFSAAWLAIWAMVFFVLTALTDHARLRRVFIGLASAAGASLLFYAVLYAWSGYHLFDVLDVAMGQHGVIMEGGNQATWRQYFHLTVANPVAFFAGTGLVLAVLWAPRTWNDVSSTRRRITAGGLLNLTFLGSLLIVVLAPLYTLEVERIWIFLVPLVAIAAARELRSGGQAAHPGPAVRMTFLLLGSQVVLMEALLNTLW